MFRDRKLIGFCAQTVGETAALLKAGCTDILLTNALPIHRSLQLAALAKANPKSAISALVDCPEHVATLNAAARDHQTTIGALIEIECGQNRGGCAAASETSLALARAIGAASNLTWGGLHVYHGAIQHVRDPAERQGCVDAGPAAAARATVAQLAAEGIACPVVTGGGTGTLMQDLEASTHGELQPGSYLFMDGDYNANADAGAKRFEQSLFIHTTVVSSDAAQGKRVLDAGAKAVDLVSGMPTATALTDRGLATRLASLSFRSGGDEHGMLFDCPSDVLPVGSHVQLLPSHCDPTVNLHDWFVGVRDGRVEALFEIDARGPG